MTKHDVTYVQKCIKEDIHKFYTWRKWKILRQKILKEDKFECQICKSKGRYARATTVHHVNYVKKHPELSLEPYYEWGGKKKRNLISLCHDCHEEVHGYRRPERKEISEERWD